MKQFEIRGFNLCESILRHTPDQLRSFIQRMKRLNMNTLIVHYDYGWKRYKDIILEECKNAGVEITLMTFGPRTFLSYVQCDKKWFAKKEDGSRFNELLECETYLCPFANGVLEAYEYGAKQWLRSLPKQIKHVHMRAADGLNFCQCERCRTLPDHEKWQPFVDVFTKAVLETNSQLSFETDVYVKRYSIPENSNSFHKMSNIMFDTFYRHTSYHIGSTMDLQNADLLNYACTIGEKVSARTPNEYYLQKLTEWTKKFPNKIYIHENAMKQSYFGTFQHGTSAYLKDLELFEKLGIAGVCYEAYEPGYYSFSKMFEILADAMNGKAVDYKETEIEKEIKQTSMNLFCNDPSFNLEKYITDPFDLKCAQLYRSFWTEHSPKNYADYVEFAFENKDKMDPIFIGFAIADWGVRWNKLKFTDLSEEASKMLCTNKLWDFMENIPVSEDPIKVCSNIIFELVRKAQKA